MKLKPILKLSFFTFFLITSFVNSQPQKIMNSAEIINALEKLNTLGSVLYIAAHPDDENIAYELLNKLAESENKL